MRTGILLLAALILACQPAQAGPRRQHLATNYLVVINPPTRTLSVYENGQLIHRCPCGVGRPEKPSPVGAHHIITRVVRPVWYKPNSTIVVPPGPDNPLGSRWLGLSEPGYGIHGTNVPSSVGWPVSSGCIRLSDADILWLFQRLPIGTPVRIVYRPVQVTSDRQSGLKVVEVYPDLYSTGILTPEYVVEQAGRAGLALTTEAAMDIVARVNSNQAASDAGATLTCNGQAFPANAAAINGEVCVPAAPVAQALGLDTGAIRGVEGYPRGIVPVGRLSEALGLPLSILPAGPQQAVISPVAVYLTGERVPAATIVRPDGVWLEAAPLLTAIDGAGLTAQGAVGTDPDVEPTLLQRLQPVELLVSAGREYVHTDQLARFIGRRLVLVQGPGTLNLFLTSP